MELNYKLIGKRIQKSRKMRGYSQEKLAEMLDISHNYLRFLETGRRRPSLDVLYAISSVLDVSMDSLLTGTNNSNHIAVDVNFVALLKDCRPYEQQIITTVATQVKILLIDHRPEIEAYLKQHTINRFHPY